MHEFAICKDLVEAVVTETAKIRPKPCRLVKARVVVGALRQIVPDNLMFAYGILSKDTIVEGSVLEVRPLPVVGKCETCGWQGEMAKDNFSCEECKSDKVELVGGTELYLDNLEVTTDTES